MPHLITELTLARYKALALPTALELGSGLTGRTLGDAMGWSTTKAKIVLAAMRADGSVPPKVHRGRSPAVASAVGQAAALARWGDPEQADEPKARVDIEAETAKIRAEWTPHQWEQRNARPARSWQVPKSQGERKWNGLLMGHELS
jgi:hypothetical protein